jgi:hypothetical protein
MVDRLRKEANEEDWHKECHHCLINGSESGFRKNDYKKVL